MITKKREGGVWRIYVNGKRTTLYIIKGDEPRYREVQTYDLCDDDLDWVFEGRGVSLIMDRLNVLQRELGK